MVLQDHIEIPEEAEGLLIGTVWYVFFCFIPWNQLELVAYPSNCLD